MAKSTKPRLDGSNWKCARTWGIRAAQLAKANPDPIKEMYVARTARLSRSSVVSRVETPSSAPSLSSSTTLSTTGPDRRASLPDRGAAF